MSARSSAGSPAPAPDSAPPRDELFRCVGRRRGNDKEDEIDEAGTQQDGCGKALVPTAGGVQWRAHGELTQLRGADIIERDGIHAMKISPEAAEKVVGVIFPADEGATPTLDSGYPGEEALDQANVACNGLTVGDLAWAAYCGWNGAARSSHKNRTAPLRAHDGSVLASAQHVHRGYAPLENAFECVPTALSVSRNSDLCLQVVLRRRYVGLCNLCDKVRPNREPPSLGEFYRRRSAIDSCPQLCIWQSWRPLRSSSGDCGARAGGTGSAGCAERSRQALPPTKRGREHRTQTTSHYPAPGYGSHQASRFQATRRSRSSNPVGA